MSCDAESGNCRGKVRVTIYAIVFVATLLLMGGLVRLMIAYTRAPDTTATRAAERVKFLAEYRQANQPLVQTYGVVDAAKGVYRLPVDVAVQLTLKEWQNPAAAKSNLVDRVEKATFVPPPPPPKPSVYE